MKNKGRGLTKWKLRLFVPGYGNALGCCLFDFISQTFNLVDKSEVSTNIVAVDGETKAASIPCKSPYKWISECKDMTTYLLASMKHLDTPVSELFIW
jgi:hypothetical protein